MQIINSIFTAIVIVLISCGILSADSFDDFLKKEQVAAKGFIAEEKQEFKSYLDELKKEFKEYKRIVEKEYKQYKKELLRHWDSAEISDKKKWVEYSADYKTKRVVDFGKNQIKIEIITDRDEKTEKKVAEILMDILSENKEAAFNRDRLAVNIENSIKQKIKYLKTDKVEKKPVLASLFTGRDEPSKKELSSIASALMKKAKKETRPANISDSRIVSITIPFSKKAAENKAETYRLLVNDCAKKQKIDNALVMAVIHTESAFNPMAKSSTPAYGLMQIVPQSAGLDATEFVYGKPVLLSPSYLYNDRNNVTIGTAYLHILNYRYLKKIKNPESRLYCAIASYNTGAGNVARAFTGSKNISKGANVINRMNSEAVYAVLIKKLPYEETREYLKRVIERIRLYQ
ncbi:MAG: DUF3393 domain-containing protein [Desulfobacteraceae bacterium]|nr:DUF3393 domain-containing protein [Desulfobacteraceae bacterium]MBC2720805.1 DUF3393 domain-containing protein [Desulfobacteraceae bacterium]